MNREYITSLLADNYTDKWLWGGARWDCNTIERLQNSNALENFGYKVYSQNDEDGIIQEIFRRIGTTNKVFIEFGLQDGLESNTHFLLFKDWTGLWIECSDRYYREICKKFVNVIKNGQLKVLKAFITKDNINQLFAENGFCGEIDLLSIDIDGNDYYVFENIEVVNPRVVIMEYNGKFPPDYEWAQTYNAEHIWDGSDRHGASLKALEVLANKKGYALVGTNINGCNAFFVRKDLIDDSFLKPLDAEYMYNPMRVNLKHKSGHPSENCLYKINEGVSGVFDFYPDEQIHFIYGFSDVEENDCYKYRYLNSVNAKIYVRGNLVKDNHIVLKYINPFPQKEFTISFYNQGKQLLTKHIHSDEGEINIPLEHLNDDNGTYSLDIEIDRLYVANKIYGGNDYRSLGIGFIVEEVL